MNSERAMTREEPCDRLLAVTLTPPSLTAPSVW
jgi:hypothetical protein